MSSKPDMTTAHGGTTRHEERTTSEEEIATSDEERMTTGEGRSRPRLIDVVTLIGLGYVLRDWFGPVREKISSEGDGSSKQGHGVIDTVKNYTGGMTHGATDQVQKGGQKVAEKTEGTTENVANRIRETSEGLSDQIEEGGEEIGEMVEESGEEAGEMLGEGGEETSEMLEEGEGDGGDTREKMGDGGKEIVEMTDEETIVERIRQTLLK